MRILIFYGSTTGNTEEAAENIKEAMGDCVSHMVDICKIEPEVLLNYDVLIFGVPTWDVGQLQMDWETFLPRMEGLDLNNKKIALFGLGDSEVYSLNFLDALGLVWNEVSRRYVSDDPEFYIPFLWREKHENKKQILDHDKLLSNNELKN